MNKKMTCYCKKRAYLVLFSGKLLHFSMNIALNSPVRGINTAIKVTVTHRTDTTTGTITLRFILKLLLQNINVCKSVVLTDLVL